MSRESTRCRKKDWRILSPRARVLLERSRKHGMDNLSASDWDYLCDNLHYGTQELDRLIEKAMHTTAKYDDSGYPL